MPGKVKFVKRIVCNHDHGCISGFEFELNLNSGLFIQIKKRTQVGFLSKN